MWRLWWLTMPHCFSLYMYNVMITYKKCPSKLKEDIYSRAIFMNDAIIVMNGYKNKTRHTCWKPSCNWYVRSWCIQEMFVAVCQVLFYSSSVLDHYKALVAEWMYHYNRNYHGMTLRAVKIKTAILQDESYVLMTLWSK